MRLLKNMYETILLFLNLKEYLMLLHSCKKEKIMACINYFLGRKLFIFLLKHYYSALPLSRIIIEINSLQPDSWWKSRKVVGIDLLSYQFPQVFAHSIKKILFLNIFSVHILSALHELGIVFLKDWMDLRICQRHWINSIQCFFFVIY